MRIAKREDGGAIPMPEECRPVAIDRTYTPDEFPQIARGRVSETMDHKWFIFFEDPWLYFHRSWTGAGLYKVSFASVESGIQVAEAWANPGYSHQSPMKPDDSRQTTFDSLELLALLDRLAGRPTREMWRRYFDALSQARPKKFSGRISVDGVLYRWKARELLPGLRIAVQVVEQSGAILILHTKQDIVIGRVKVSEIAAAIQNALTVGWEPQRPGPPFKLAFPF